MKEIERKTRTTNRAKGNKRCYQQVEEKAINRQEKRKRERGGEKALTKKDEERRGERAISQDADEKSSKSNKRGTG